MNSRKLQVGMTGLLLLLSALPQSAWAKPQLSLDDPRTVFFERLRQQCDAVYEGTSSFPADPDDAFFGKRLVARVSSCSEEEVRVAFAVGDDNSRTWIIKRSPDGLRLQHDHRHADGTPDEITMYGGWANEAGSRRSQSFAADEHTRQLIPAAATNVWTLSFDSEDRLTYYLERNAEPRFKATLTRIGSGR